MSGTKRDWRAVVAQLDPVAREKLDAFEAHVVARDSRLPRKYKALILMAGSAAIRDGGGTRTHGCEAMYCGATDEEIVEVLSLVSITAGFPALADGIAALADQLTLAED